MHEIQVTVPQGKGKQVAELAQKAGISEVSAYPVHVYGANEDKEVLSMEANVPHAKAFMDALLTAKFFDPRKYSVMLDDVDAIVSAEKPAEVTKPMTLSTMDVFQDLWMRIHITPSYVLRSAVSALLLAYGMVQNDLTTMIAALLFSPFQDQAMAVSFGLLAQEWTMVRRAILAVLTSTALALVAGIVVASLMQEPVQFDQFSPVLDNFLISLIVGAVATAAISDKTGRRELIGIAAASQFTIYPVWFGLHIFLGMPGPEETVPKATAFVVNIVTIVVISAIAYALLKHRREVVKSYSAPVGES